MPSVHLGEPGPIGGAELDAAYEGRFKIDVLRMELARRSTKVVEYKGPGVIYMDGSGRLQYTMYDVEQRTDLVQLFRRFEGRPRWLTDDDYFDLTARDIRGREWAAERVLTAPSGHAGQPGVVCTGEITELRYSAPQPTSADYVILVYRGNLALPRNLLEWNIEASQYQLGIRNLSEVWTAHVRQTDVPLPRKVHWRIEESLFVATGTLAHWFIHIDQTTDVYRFTIRRRPDPPVRGRFAHPTASPALGAGAEFDLFLRTYLAHIWHYDEDRFHVMSSAIYQVVRSSRMSVLAEAMTIGPVLERLVKSLFSYLVPPQDLIANELDAVLEAIDACPVSRATKERVAGCLQVVRNPSASDVFRALVRYGVLQRQEFSRWKRVRNAAVHGEDVPDDLARLADDTAALFVTIFKLVMQVIRYEGKYLDWGATQPHVAFAPATLPDPA